MPERKIIWFDITEIKGWDGHFTGIQRVVFSIGNELVGDPALDVRLCRYDRRRNIFVRSDYAFIEPQYDEPLRNQLDQGKKPTATDYVRKFIGTALPASLKKRIKAVTSFNTWPFVSIGQPVKFLKSDILFIPGAFWTGSLGPLTEMKKHNKPRVFTIMYDMVPVLMPQFCVKVTVSDFKKEIKKAANLVDNWLAISENTKKDLITYAEKEKLSIPKSTIEVIRLGSDINTKGSIKSPFKKSNRPRDFVLFVSTVEARKNQQLVYQAVKRAEELRIDIPTIVLVGKHGWHSDDIASVLKQDKTLRGKIIWLEDADDRALRWLYKRCMFTIYPSVYEGWGLPIAESLAYGKFAIASSASSIPEVAGDLIEYFSPYSVDEFLNKMSLFYSDQDALRVRTSQLKKFIQPSWTNTAQVISTLIKKK